MLALRVGTDKITNLMKDAAQRGDTGDAFVIGEDLLMRSQARLTKSTVLKQKVDTNTAREALSGREGTETGDGLQGCRDSDIAD